MPGPRPELDSLARQSVTGAGDRTRSSLVATGRLQISRDVSAESDWFAGFPPADRLAALLERNVKPLMIRVVRGIRVSGRTEA